MRWLALSLVLLPLPAVCADEKDELVAKQRAHAMEILKKCNVASPTQVETQDLILCGGFTEEKLKAMGAVVQKNYTAAFKSLKFEMTENPPEGKVAIYFFPDRKQYGQFVREIVNDRLETDDRVHVDARSKEPYLAVSILPGEKPTDLDVEAANQVAVALLQAKAGGAKLPVWVQEGFARAMKMRSDPARASTDRGWLKKNLYGQSRYKVSDIWMAGNDKERPVMAASLMEYFVFGPGAPKLSKFLIGFRTAEGDPKPTIDTVLSGADFTVDKLDAAWKKWVQTGR